MRPTSIRFVVIGIVALICTVAAGSDPGESDAPAERPIQGIPLRRQMVLIQSAVSRIATDAPDELRRPEALAGIEEVQRRIVEAKRATPPRFGGLDQAAQQRHDRAFRVALAELLIESAVLEIAVLEGASERIASSLAELTAMRERAHATFQPPREKRERPRADLRDLVELTPEQRQAYVGAYEFQEVGFRLTVAERDGVLFLETFGQPAERLYAMGGHAFRIAVSAEAEIRFDLDEHGRARAILLDPGGGHPPQRIERVR